ncbi:MAG: hypothetical protein NE330_10395 [Lentisphaeraceae bacterium]|nr:hypothetical protein [Lentisphaeraceae bacterium]
MTENVYSAPESSFSNDASKRIGGIRVEGDLLICKSGKSLPKRCIKTNKDLDVNPQSKKAKLYWCPPWVLLSFLIAGLLTVILYLCLRKKCEITYFLSDETVSKNKRNNLIFTSFIFIAIALMFFLTAEINVVLGILIFLSLIALSMVNNLVSIKKYRNGEFYIKGCHPGFLNYIESET